MTTIQDHADRREGARIALGNMVAEADFRDGHAPVTVCIWDLSVSGACLMVPLDLHLPREFDLYIDGCRQAVKKVWHRWAYVGVSLQRPASHRRPEMSRPWPSVEMPS